MRADIHDGQGARNAPCNGPNTDARDQLSPDHYIRLAPHGRSIHKYMARRGDHSGRAGARFCVTMRRASQPWICSWSRPSALTCSMCWSLFGWLGESLSGSIRQHTRRRQNCFAERLIGSIRRECVDHVVALGEQHLREVLKSYASYYNTARTHRSLAKDAPISRPVQRIGRIVSHTLVGGLHHQYVRI